MDGKPSDNHGQAYRKRRALIDAVSAIWGDDSEMLYLILWFWGGREASRLTSPEEAQQLLALAATGPESGMSDVLRTRLRVLHEHVHPEWRLAA